MCAPCPAGTFSAGGASAACVPCFQGTVAARAGSAACRECEPGLAPSNGSTACVPCFAGGRGAGLAPSGRGGGRARRAAAPPARAGGPSAATPLEDLTCSAVECPPASLPDPLGLCISSDPGTGRLCVAGAAPTAPQLGPLQSCGQGRPMRQGGPPAVGGAVLQLTGGLGDATGRACDGGVRQLAAFLANATTWAGLRYSLDGSPQDSGVFWQVRECCRGGLGAVARARSRPLLARSLMPPLLPRPRGWLRRRVASCPQRTSLPRARAARSSAPPRRATACWGCLTPATTWGRTLGTARS
jgi:hypothetical protein